MSKEKKLIPVLRFPEFVKEGWMVKTLGAVAENVMYGMNSSAFEYDGENKYIRITDIDEETRMFTPNPLTSPEGLLEEKYSVNLGDLLFARTGASVGKSYLHRMENRKIYFAGFLIRVKIKDAVPYFIYAQTLTAQYQKWVLATSARSGQPGINAEEYKTFPIYLPNSEQEQQKIATCLSSLDEVITAEIQKLDLLKHHKKGLLQNLFPQEGETVPKYRFKEYENSGEWVEKTLGSIGKFTGGGTPSKANDSFWQGTIPWISSSDIMEDSIHQIKITRFISEGGLKDSATKIVPANSILIVSRVGVGKLAISNEVICTSQDFTNFTPYNDNLTLLAYYLKTQTILLLGFSQGMAIKGFTKEDISKLNLFLPKIEEQQKIADTLSSIDEFITAQSQTIEALKLHKKGLLQGLFPKIEA